MAPGCVVVRSVNQALRAVQGAEEVMVIGGGAIYKEFMPLAEKIYLTKIHARIEGDVYFPELNKDEWKEKARQDFGSDDKNPYNYSFIILKRLEVDKDS